MVQARITFVYEKTDRAGRMTAPAIRRITGLLAIALLASAAWGLSMCLGRTPIVWGMFGFEALTVAAGVVGVLFALGRFPDSPAMTLIIITGTVFISSGLGLVALGLSPRAVLTHPLFLVRFGVVGALTLLAALAALERNRFAWRLLVRGVFLCIASVGLLGMTYATRGWWLSGSGVVEVIFIIGATLGGVVLLTMLCIGAHLVIRAFEVALAPGAKPNTGNAQEAL